MAGPPLPPRGQPLALARDRLPTRPRAQISAARRHAPPRLLFRSRGETARAWQCHSQRPSTSATTEQRASATATATSPQPTSRPHAAANVCCAAARSGGAAAHPCGAAADRTPRATARLGPARRRNHGQRTPPADRERLLLWNLGRSFPRLTAAQHAAVRAAARAAPHAAAGTTTRCSLSPSRPPCRPAVALHGGGGHSGRARAERPRGR